MMTPTTGRRRLLHWSLCLGALVGQQAIAQALAEQEQEPTPVAEVQSDREQSGRKAAAETETHEHVDAREAKEAEQVEPRPDGEREPRPEPEYMPEPDEPEREPPAEESRPPQEGETEAESKPEPEADPAPIDSEDADPETPNEAEPETAEPEPLRPPMRRGGSLLGTSMAPPPIPVPPRQTPPDTSSPAPDTLAHEPGELLLVSVSMAAAQQAARQLQGYQLQVKSRDRLDHLGLVVSVFRLPPGTQVPTLVARLRSDLPDLNLDTNQRYQPLNARRAYGQRMIGWPASSGACAGDFRIGLLDTRVTEQHPALADTALTRHNFVRGESAPAEHGTAIASLLIGKPESITPGLLPGSELFAAEVFRLRDTAEDKVIDTTTGTLLSALDWLSGQQVQAINLSLGGERNQVFEVALAQLLERNIRLIAAAGNQGPDAPAVFPAGQPGVIAVTAVDAAEQLYPDANQGDHIELAAPGVDVWSADADTGGRYHSGTSFAAPFVTAALLLAERQGLDLRQTAKDLGPEGRDRRFGWGLIKVPGDCP